MEHVLQVVLLQHMCHSPEASYMDKQASHMDKQASHMDKQGISIPLQPSLIQGI
jgi:hypothetical protein